MRAEEPVSKARVEVQGRIEEVMAELDVSGPGATQSAYLSISNKSHLHQNQTRPDAHIPLHY